MLGRGGGAGAGGGVAHRAGAGGTYLLTQNIALPDQLSNRARIQKLLEQQSAFATVLLVLLRLHLCVPGGDS